MKTYYIIKLLYLLYKLCFRMPKISHYVPMSFAFFGKLRISQKYFGTKKTSNRDIFLRLRVMQKALQLFFFLFSSLFFCREFLYWEIKVFWIYFIIFTQDVSDQYWTYSRDMQCPLKIVHELKPKNWVFGSGRWTKHN